MVIFGPERTVQNNESAVKNKSDKTFKFIEELIEKAKPEHLGVVSHSDAKARFREAFAHRASFCIPIQILQHLRLRVVVSSYNEYFTLTYLIDTVGHEAVFCSAADFARAIYNSLCNQHLIDNETSFSSCEGQTRLLYEVIWDFVDIFFKGESFDSFVEVFRDRIVGDMRGLCLSASPECGVEVDGDVFCELQTTLLQKNNSKPDIRSALKEQTEFFRSVLDFDTSPHIFYNSMGQADIFQQTYAEWDRNSVLCFIADGGAIYGSTLASIPKKDGRPSAYYLRYFIISDGDNSFTTGRLVRRMHVLYELRIMAFVERQEIMSVYDALLSIGRSLSTAIGEMTDKSILDVKSLNRILRDYNEIGAGYEQIEVDGRVRDYIGVESGANVGYTKCYGGLIYRVNRSRYYFESMMNRIDDLRVKRIKGFQPYDRFVQRNYIQTMDAINSIADRYLQLGSRVERAISLSHALVQRKMTQYAFIATIIFSGFSALSALGGASNVLSGYNNASVKIYSLGFIMLSFIFIASLWSSIYWLKQRGLYVSISKGIMSIVFIWSIMFAIIFMPFFVDSFRAQIFGVFGFGLFDK